MSLKYIRAIQHEIDKDTYKKFGSSNWKRFRENTFLWNLKFNFMKYDG